MRWTLNPHLACLFLVVDPRWRKKIFLGGLLLMLPIVGWPIILGYRKALVSRLWDGENEVLPPWENRIATYCLEGLKAMGVIFGYFGPLFLALIFILATRDFQFTVWHQWAALFFFLFPIFSTLLFPSFVISILAGNPSYLSANEAVVLISAYVIATFIIPSGFLEVSRSGKYLCAFRLDKTLPFIQRHFRAYSEAWILSSAMSLLGHLCLPFSPWGVVWCYVGIIYCFNEVLYLSKDQRDIDRGANSWYRHLTGAPLTSEISSNETVAILKLSDAYPNTYALKIAFVWVPLPRIVTNRLNGR